MANYKMRIDEETGITFIEVIGTSAPGDHFAFMSSEEYKNRTSRLVADARLASLTAMSRGAIAKMLRKVKPLARPGIRAAFIFNRGEDFNKAKSFLAQIEVLGFDGDFGVFTEPEKAISWVKE